VGEEARSVSSAFSHYDVPLREVHAYDSIQPFTSGEVFIREHLGDFIAEIEVDRIWLLISENTLMCAIRRFIEASNFTKLLTWSRLD